MEYPSKNKRIYCWSKVLRCLPNRKNTHNASRTKRVSKCQIRNIEHLSTQGKVQFSKFVIKPPTHPLKMDDVGASNGFFKIRVGKFEKLRQNQQLKYDAMFVYLCWTQSVTCKNMRETLWNSQKIQTKKLWLMIGENPWNQWYRSNGQWYLKEK